MSDDLYQKGIHLIVDLAHCNSQCVDIHAFESMILTEIAECELNILGKVFHQFDNGAFTAVICLTESHLSVHTWPEFGRVTFDVFLSNYQQVNNDKAHRLSRSIQLFFGGDVAQLKEVHR